MKFPLSLLKKFLDTNADIQTLAAKLTSIGLEVEEIIDRREELKNFIVAEIIEALPHPDANSLKVCKVNNGDSILQIVCGAKNAREGIKVVLAPIGSKIPSNDMVIKPIKIRGIESSGMLCSEKEILVGDSDEGIIEINEEIKLGNSFLSLYGLDDPVINVAITPNRGDCFGVYGIARDLSATGIGELKILDIPTIKVDFKSDFNIVIDEKNLCDGFSVYEIRNIENKQSPTWLKNILKNSGISSISFIVDVTNYISLAFGKPLHVYDRDKISNDLIVKKLNEETKFLALNDKEYSLSNSDLVISSNSKVVTIAGVIGGKDSSCSIDTKNIIIESAIFDKVIITKMGRKHSIITDSRQKFERGVDRNFIENGLILAAQMIQKYCGGELSQMISYKKDFSPKKIDLEYKTVEDISGIKIDKKIIIEIFKKLGFDIIENNDYHLSLIIPSWRHDISIEEDLVEEILRIYGLDKVEEIPIEKFFKPRILSFKQKVSTNFKRIMASRNYFEVVTWSFGNSDDIKQFIDLSPSLYIQNPISSELNYLRPTIIPNLMNLIEKAINKDFMDYGFFEVGPVFNGVEPNNELIHIAGVKYGKKKTPLHFESRNIDIYDIKSDISILLQNAGISIDSIVLDRSNLPKYYHPGKSASLKLGKNTIGYFGELHPSIMQYYKIKVPICLFEIIIDNLPEQRLKYGWSSDFSELNFQSSKRDFAFILDKSIEAGSISLFIKNIDKKLIESVEIFDIYNGDKIPENKKSVAYEVTLRSSDKTLSEEEINNICDKIINKVSEKFSANLRFQ